MHHDGRVGTEWCFLLLKGVLGAKLDDACPVEEHARTIVVLLSFNIDHSPVVQDLAQFRSRKGVTGARCFGFEQCCKKRRELFSLSEELRARNSAAEPSSKDRSALVLVGEFL